MSRYELNLAGLRHNRIPRLIPPHGATTLQARTQWNDLALTRRDFFGAAAFAGLSLSPTLNAVEAVLAAGEGSFTSEVSETRIAFTMRGRERWVIDTHAFGGRPRLMANRTYGQFRIELAGAPWPAQGQLDLRRTGSLSCAGTISPDLRGIKRSWGRMPCGWRCCLLKHQAS